MSYTSYVSLGTTVILLGLALFCAFVPFEWICVLLGLTSCNVSHGLVVAIAMMLFLGAIVASNKFDLRYTFLESGK